VAKDLITIAEYKAYAGISSTQKDASIALLIPKISAFCKSYCKRTFVDYVDDAKVEVYNGGEYFVLGETPVLSVSSVEISGDYGKTYSALTEYTDFVLDVSEATIKPLSSTAEFVPLINGYRVTYNAGFESVPEDLKIAVMDLLTYYLKGDMAVKSQRDAGSNTVQIEYITKNTLPAHIARVFDLYIASM